MRRVARRRNRCRNKAPSRRRAPRPPTRERSRSATNWRDPTACSARPQELTRKFAHQRLRRAICRSFLHPAALAAIRRSGRNKSGVAATSRRGRLVCSSNKEPPSSGLLFANAAAPPQPRAEMPLKASLEALPWRCYLGCSMACQAFGQCHRRHSIDALSPSQCQTHLRLATSRLLSVSAPS